MHLPKDDNAYYIDGVYVDGGNTVGEGNAGLGGQYANNYAGYNAGYDRNYNQPLKIPGYQELPTRLPSVSRTNYVTSDGYMPGLNNSGSFLNYGGSSREITRGLNQNLSSSNLNGSYIREKPSETRMT